jgi:hypothetical protein
MDIPATILTLVGERILRMGTSTDRQRFFFDIPAANRNSDRTRYGYYLPEGRILRSLGIEHLLGRTVLDVYDGGTEGTDTQKLVFETNPDGTKIENCIFWLQITEPTSAAYWLLEEDPEVEWELEETEIDFWELEESEGPAFASIEDTAIPRNIYSSVDSEERFYIIQEDDFREPEYE